MCLEGGGGDRGGGGGGFDKYKKQYILYQAFNIQSTLVISKSKGPSETLRDIRTSTYQICRIEENTN